MRRLADSYGDRLLVGEVFHDDPELASSYHGKENEELHLAFNFEFLFQPWSARRFARAAKRWYDVLPAGAWPNFTLSNHDQKRHISRYSFGRHTEARARIAAAMLLTVKGTPFLYYGEEIGMRNSPIRKQHLRDPLGRRTWPFPFGRDGERTPMQWSARSHGGFTKAAPWLPVHPDHVERNVAAQREDPESLLNFYRELIARRSNSPALLEGAFTLLNEGKRNVLVYERRSGSDSIIIILNFSGRSRHTSLPGGKHSLLVLFGTHRRRGDLIKLNGSGGHIRLDGHEVLLLRPQLPEQSHA
jgi:alpha-glucosidase